MTVAEERSLEPLVGGNARRFFALAQRCTWGVSQPDLVRVDVPATLDQLEREFPRCFASYLVRAFAEAKSRPEHATEAYARAEALCSVDHPWRYLLADAPDWTKAPPEPGLVEVHETGLYRVHGYTWLEGTPFHIASTMTIVRLSGGELALINPGPVSQALLAAIQGLGAVRYLITQGRGHNRYLESSRAHFPQAELLGTHGHTQHPRSAHVRFDGLLGTPSAQLPSELMAFPVEGTKADEVVLLHRPSRTLIFQDLVANNLPANTARGFGGRVYYLSHGLAARIGIASYNVVLWDDLRGFQRGLQAIVAADFERVTGAHWPLALSAGAEVSAFRQTLSWASGLSAWQHKSMVARYLAGQPGFLIDLVRYSLASRSR